MSKTRVMWALPWRGAKGPLDIDEHGAWGIFGDRDVALEKAVYVDERPIKVAVTIRVVGRGEGKR